MMQTGRELIDKVNFFATKVPHLTTLVVGDLILDEYLWGNAERISPEAPVQVVDVQHEDLRLGGAGNVVNNLIALSSKVKVASVLGEDVDGDLLLRKLQDIGVGTEGVFRQSSRMTSRKTRILASNQQMLRIDRESRDAIGADLESALVERVRSLASSVDVILISDYGKGVLTETVLREVIGIAREYGRPVLVDPKGSDYSRYRGATLLTPNRKEAQAAAAIQARSPQDYDIIGSSLQEKLDLDALVMTRSEEGMSLYFRGGRKVHLPTEAREVFDVSGAGDTVLVVLGLCLACGFELDIAAGIANLAAGLVVGKVGTSTASLDELLQSASGYPGLEKKIQTSKELSERLKQAQLQGKTVVFTNGCFDLLHVGHVRYLQEARQLGDMLVLGLNSDSSIQRLKGEERPLIVQEERAHILAAMDCIDYVVIFEEDTPLNLIQELEPNILVKGGDYDPDGVVGKEVVEQYGGRVEIIPFVDGRSTSGIIEKIRRSPTTDAE